VRVVLDTNILISACLKPDGLEARTVNLARGGAFTLCISSAVWAEYSDVLFRKKFAAVHADAVDMLRALEEHAVVVTAVTRPLQLASDEDDNRLLECAEAAGAAYLVTGNRRHFPAAWEPAQIVNAREFLTQAFGMVAA
jgi:putative PIN family toxin of toxin-antitoxin system